MEKAFQARYWEDENRFSEVTFRLMLEYISNDDLTKTFLKTKKNYEIDDEFIKEIEETSLILNLESITEIYKRQMYVIVNTYIELMMKEFLTCYFSIHHMSMYEYLRTKTKGGQIQEGLVSLKKIDKSESKESLIEKLAKEATSTFMTGKFSSQLDRLENMLKKKIPPNIKSKLLDLANIRNEIVHEHKYPNITDSDVFDAYKLFHDLIYYLATTSKKININVNWNPLSH